MYRQHLLDRIPNCCTYLQGTLDQQHSCVPSASANTHSQVMNTKEEECNVDRLKYAHTEEQSDKGQQLHKLKTIKGNEEEKDSIHE